MSKKRTKKGVVIFGLVMMVVLGVLMVQRAALAGPADKAKVNIEKIKSGQLSAVSKSIDEAIAAIKSGDNKKAIAELQKAKKIIAGIQKSLSVGAEAKFVNTRCPIMGSPINPAKVGKGLVRDHKGQKVAFCCGGCPGAWDKLTDSEKDAKLTKAK